MTSKARTQNKFLSPAPGTEPLISEAAKTKRQATVYDAVAGETSQSIPRKFAHICPGRISAAGFIPDRPVIAASRDTASSSSIAEPPEAVLFRRKNAPMRYEESDFYFASDSLQTHALPDSDLLKALHCYTSDFYSRATADGGRGDWRSMDETSLLAMGILMEEVCRESLGATGDMVFTEGELRNKHSHRSLFRGEGQSAVSSSLAAVRSGRTRTGKRRRQDVEDSSN